MLCFLPRSSSSSSGGGVSLCLEVERCCFCVDLRTAAHAIALVEATLAAPMLVHGVAATSVGHLFAGLVLVVSAWVLFDGAFLSRRGLLAGWLLATAAKVLSLLSAGVVCTFIVSEMAAPGATSSSSSGGGGRQSPVLDSLGAIGDSYLSCCVFDFNGHKTLFYVIYAVAFFASAFGYTYGFVVVHSFRRSIKVEEDKLGRGRGKGRKAARVRRAKSAEPSSASASSASSSESSSRQREKDRRRRRRRQRRRREEEEEEAERALEDRARMGTFNRQQDALTASAMGLNTYI